MEPIKYVLIPLMVGMIARGLWSLAFAGWQIAEYKKLFSKS